MVEQRLQMAWRRVVVVVVCFGLVGWGWFCSTSGVVVADGCWDWSEGVGEVVAVVVVSLSMVLRLGIGDLPDDMNLRRDLILEWFWPIVDGCGWSEMSPLVTRLVMREGGRMGLGIGERRGLVRRFCCLVQADGGSGCVDG